MAIVDIGTELVWAEEEDSCIRCCAENEEWHLIYHEDTGYLGYQVQDKNVTHIFKLFVSPSARRQGIGRSLIDRIPKTKVLVVRYPSSVPFYVRCGFKPKDDGWYVRRDLKK